MLDPQASRFWQAALLSDLMDAERLNACWNAIPPEKRDAPEHIDRRLARQAVHAKALTLWQAQQLLAGRTTGFRVDRYVLMDMIGQGGMGRVYLAIDSRLNRRVALKILAPERVNNPRAVARFQREARVGAQLQHENLVRIYDFGESSGRYYLVMEYIEGKTIGTLITEQGPMPPATAVRLVRQVAVGLEHAHRKGLIHRDVNPYNILVTHDGIAKLADLGLAINLAEEDRVTREGATVGTFDYVAPEQARHSHSADIRSDIYSLGCTLYHMISGQVPFPTPSLPEKLFAHQAMEPTRLDKLVPGLSAALAEVVGRMMRKSPDERYAAPFLVAQALEPFESTPNCTENGADLARPIHQAGVETSPRSPEFMGDVPQFTAVSPAVMAKVALAPASRQAEHTDTGPSSSPKSDAARSPVSTRSPSNDTAVSDPDFPVLVDLGPEPSLSEGLLRPKSRFANVFSTTPGSATTPHTPVVDTETAADKASARPFWPFPIWLWGLAALTFVAIAGILLVAVMSTPDRDSQPTANRRRPNLSNRPDGDLPEAAASRIDRSKPLAKRKQPFVVRLPDSEEMSFDNLLLATQTAMANRGYVELRNTEPYQVGDDNPLDFRGDTGTLEIRAAPGIVPVIEFESKGRNPLLTTGSSLSLALSGLTIVVHYPKGETAPAPPLPIIKAVGMARIDRCSFRVADSSRRRDSRAIVFEGNALEVNRCWLEGFDEAIDVSLVSKSVVRIQQTMVVPSAAPASFQPQLPDWYGWAVKVGLSAGMSSQTKSSQPHLTLDHCTLEGAGMLDLASKLSSAVLQVEVKHCAVRTEALLACGPGKPGEPLGARVHWLGTGNQYDILGRSWIVLSAHEGTPQLSTAVEDLHSWSKTVATEMDLIQSKLNYLNDPAKRPLQLQPRDFAIKHSGSSQNQPGADPDLVGPESKP